MASVLTRIFRVGALVLVGPCVLAQQEEAAREPGTEGPIDPQELVRALGEALRRGMRREEESCMARAAKIDAGLAPESLIGFLENEPDLFRRLAAAKILHAQACREGLERMIREWKELCDAPEPIGEPWCMKGYDDLVEFLATSEDPSAIRALGAAFVSPHSEAAGEVLRNFEPSHGCMRNEFWNIDHTPEVLSAIEEVLLLDLASPGDPGSDQLLKGDSAACTLHSLWPERYPYAPAWHPFARAREIERLRNLAREMQGLPPLPLTPEPHVPRAPDDVTRSLLATLADPGAPRWRQNYAFHKLVDLRLGALRAVAEELQHRPDERLEELHSWLSRIVREVRVEGGDTWSESIVAHLASLLCEPLEVSDITLLLRELEGSDERFVLRVDREGPGMGFTIRLAPRPPRRDEAESGVPLLSSPLQFELLSENGAFAVGGATAAELDEKLHVWLRPPCEGGLVLIVQGGRPQKPPEESEATPPPSECPGGGEERVMRGILLWPRAPNGIVSVRRASG